MQHVAHSLIHNPQCTKTVLLDSQGKWCLGPAVLCNGVVIWGYVLAQWRQLSNSSILLCNKTNTNNNKTNMHTLQLRITSQHKGLYSRNCIPFVLPVISLAPGFIHSQPIPQLTTMEFFSNFAATCLPKNGRLPVTTFRRVHPSMGKRTTPLTQCLCWSEGRFTSQIPSLPSHTHMNRMNSLSLVES